MVKKVLNRYGVIKATAILSVFCIFVAVLLSSTIWLLAGLPHVRVVFLVAFICTVLIAPPLILSLCRLTGDLQKSRDAVGQINTALQKSEEHYRFLCENATDLILVLASDGAMLYVNSAWREKFGYAEDELSSLKFFDLVDPLYRRQYIDIFNNVLIDGWGDNIESFFITKTGRCLILQGNANCEYEEGNPLVVQCIFRDVTIQRKLEEDQFRTQKNTSLMTMAGGIAHNFNNYLSVITGNVSLALNFINNEERLTKYLTKIQVVSKKAEELTRQLMTFSREGIPAKKLNSIADIIRETAGFAQMADNINCEFHLPRELWLVEVDGGQFNQIFHNLIINATQAMPGGGIIAFGGENLDVPADSQLPLSEGKYVKVSISDQGCGIPEETQKVIFDPYFTSKKNGHGLGLAVTYSVINNHNGHIDVESKIGEGATFNLFIPAQASVQ